MQGRKNRIGAYEADIQPFEIESDSVWGIVLFFRSDQVHLQLRSESTFTTVSRSLDVVDLLIETSNDLPELIIFETFHYVNKKKNGQMVEDRLKDTCWICSELVLTQLFGYLV